MNSGSGLNKKDKFSWAQALAAFLLPDGEHNVISSLKCLQPYTLELWTKINPSLKRKKGGGEKSLLNIVCMLRVARHINLSFAFSGTTILPKSFTNRQSPQLTQFPPNTHLLKVELTNHNVHTVLLFVIGHQRQLKLKISTWKCLQ